MEKPWVLLVDDNEAIRTLITALLQREFRIEVANDGPEAVEQLKIRQFAVVLLDIRMPGGNGYAVLEFLREHNGAMLKNVIVVTAALATPDRERIAEFDICAVIPKPFEVETLLGIVRECAGPATGKPATGMLYGGMLLLIADLLHQRLT